MGAYSVLLSDSKILDRVSGLNSVVISGCPRCADFRIAYDKGVPANRIPTDEKTGETTSEPVAIAEEANRLKILVESNGINASVEMWPGGPCFLHADSEPDCLHCPSLFVLVFLPPSTKSQAGSAAGV